MIEKDCARGAGDDRVEVGVIENDHRRLPAKLQCHLLQIASGGFDDQFADFGRARERDLVDVRMGR
jgi:hypothetical protein